MPPPKNSSKSFDGGETEKVKAFFSQWRLYQKAMEHNYIFHREAYGEFRRFLLKHFDREFSVLDLGCGDATFVAHSLLGTKVAFYHGVDLSGQVLELARENMKNVPCQKAFSPGDFSRFICETSEIFDVIWVGLSLHHLPVDEKARFINACRRVLSPRGFLIVYEPMLHENESREEYVARWHRICQSSWTAMTTEEKERIYGHVSSSDFPEEFSTYRNMARRAGYQKAEALFRDPPELHELICFYF